jgi:N-acetylmuramoyl-L-alanine amidase CwlA
MVIILFKYHQGFLSWCFFVKMNYMRIINKCLSVKEFRSYAEKRKVDRKIDKIILHHTWDTIKEWQEGKVSIEYYKEMYEKKGWEAGPHLFVAPEGIWLFTDIREKGRHANEGNLGSIGIEIVGRYDDKTPSGEVWENTEAVIRTLIKKFNLSLKDIHFHREYNTDKSCPGNAVTKKWLIEKLS